MAKPNIIGTRSGVTPRGNRRRIRVLQVIDSLPQGGAEQLLVTLARSIDAGRFDLRVCSLHGLDEASPIIQDLRALHIPLYTVTSPKWHDVRHIPQVAILARSHRIDVLHTHLPYATTVGILAGALIRRPVVSTIHSIRDARHSLGRLKQTLKIQTLRRGAHTIIACAPEVGSDARERLHLPEQKVVVVPNGIDTQVFAEVDLDAAAACRRRLLGGRVGPLIVTVGNLVPAKGHEHLVEAAKALVAVFPEVQVVIVGRPTHHEELIRARITALGLQGRVLLAGQRRDIPVILAAANLFVLPSLWEGLPLALLEAMATGIPVVATAVGGVMSVVEDGVTGRLVPPGDSEGLARVITDVLSRPEEASRLGRAGQAHVRATYGAEAWAQRLQTIYAAATGK